MQVIVVGAGIAGSSLTRILRAAGVRVQLVADPAQPAHSRAAATLLRSGYHKNHPGESALFGRSLDLYASWGVPLLRGGYVTNYRTPDRAPHYDEDWYLLDPTAPLLEPDYSGHATPTERGVTVTAGPELRGEVVVWCCGAYRLPPATTSKSAAKITHGVTWTHPDPAALATPDQLRIHHYGPYKTIAAGRAGAGARLGSSSATTTAVARRQAETMLAAAAEVGLIRTTTGWHAVTGTRVKTAEPGPAQISGRHWSFTGLHRTGYALAPALAHRATLTLRAAARAAA